jgi:hypothetical protein
MNFSLFGNRALDNANSAHSRQSSIRQYEQGESSNHRQPLVKIKQRTSPDEHGRSPFLDLQ